MRVYEQQQVIVSSFRVYLSKDGLSFGQLATADLVEGSAIQVRNPRTAWTGGEQKTPIVLGGDGEESQSLFHYTHTNASLSEAAEIPVLMECMTADAV